MSTFPTESTYKSQGSGPAKIIYVLYLSSLFVGITALIGVVMAYIYRDSSASSLNTHYQFQIRTFWIGILITVIGTITTWILIGYAILFVGLIWFIIRCIKGLKAVFADQPVPSPTSWLFG